jgi:excisionase family DNA binding protein
VNELLTVRDVALLCQVHEVTVRRHISQGRLQVVRVGKAVRVRQEDFESYIEPTTPAARVVAGRQKGHPLSEDDSIFQLFGLVNDAGSIWVSGDKYRALREMHETNS